MRTREWGSTDFYAVLGVPPSAGPEEIATAVLYLAGDGATFVVGHAMAIDGGVDAM